MRINLTKKDLVNLVYMQLGFSKQISENLIEDLLSTILSNIKEEKKLKLSKFGTFSIRQKKSRIGRNPKTKEEVIIGERKVITFKPSKNVLKYLNKLSLIFSNQSMKLLHQLYALFFQLSQILNTEQFFL